MLQDERLTKRVAGKFFSIVYEPTITENNYTAN